MIHNGVDCSRLHHVMSCDVSGDGVELGELNELRDLVFFFRAEWVTIKISFPWVRFPTCELFLADFPHYPSHAVNVLNPTMPRER